MKIDKIFENFSSKMVQIELYQRAIKKNTDKELRELTEYSEKMKKQPKNIQEMSKSLDNFTFNSAKDGNHIFYGFKETTIEERFQSIFLHKNKQYQWLLAEAYEEFEDFIEKAYAYLGFSNKNLWPLKDYGNISLSELDTKDFDWFVLKAQNKQGIPKSILNHIKNNFPEIKKIESKNALKINLELAITLIEHLRHIIVHKSGIIIDKNIFVQQVLKKAGLDNNGKPKEEYVDFIKQFFGTDEYDKHIRLLEIRTNPEIPLDIHINVLRVLINYLLAYAHIVTITFLSKFSDKKEVT